MHRNPGSKSQSFLKALFCLMLYLRKKNPMYTVPKISWFFYIYKKTEYITAGADAFVLRLCPNCPYIWHRNYGIQYTVASAAAVTCCMLWRRFRLFLGTVCVYSGQSPPPPPRGAGKVSKFNSKCFSLFTYKMVKI